MSERNHAREDARPGPRPGDNTGERAGPQHDPQIAFTMDAGYYRESFDEWVAVIARGWRIDRFMIRLFAHVGVGACIAAWLSGYYPLFGLGAVTLCSAAFEAVTSRRRRAAWNRVCRALPWYGSEIRITVHDGVLVQDHLFAGDPRFARTGSILVSPNGYIVRYAAQTPIETPGPEISSINASLYIPHRAITPPMRREDFAALIGAR